MRLLAGLLALAVLFTPTHAGEAPRPPVAEALKRYYRERLQRPFIVTEDMPQPKVAPPPWTAPLKQLASAKPQERRRAAVYLRELVAQALQDERSGTAPWRATPYWGGGAENPAQYLRQEVADALAKAGAGPEVVPVLRWYLEHEPVDRFLEPIMAALAKLDGKEADALRTELASRPHDNAVVAALAIHQLAARKRSLPAERLAALCHHHRAAIRAAARKLNAQQGGKDPGPFDAARALRSEPVRKVMDQVLSLMTELPPARAEFVAVTVRYRDDKKAVKQTRTILGWLIRREKDTVEVYTPYGQPETVRQGEHKRVSHSEPAPEGRGIWISEIDITVEVSVAPRKVEDLVKEVETSRAKNSAGSDLSEGGPLTGQFRGSGATLYEAILGAWLYRAGRDAEAARVLLPALDSLYADHYFAEMVLHQLGEIHGYRMLVAFAGDRDYVQTLKHAKLINERFPDTRFHRYAQGLAEQLPRRRGDFTKLKLPTPAEWAALKKKLTREQQIDFLCERMQLLNCFQMGQPGGYFPDETQYAEPCGMAPEASWGLHKGKTEVINPLAELQGPLNWFGDDKPRPTGMNLTLRDVPRLSKYLRDDWYMLIVTFWRDFHPDRSLASTRPVFADIINGLARKDVCKVRGWEKLTPAEIDKEIERINRWAKRNADKTQVQLEWDALEGQLASGAEWHAVKNRVESLLTQQQTKAFEVMRRFLEDEKTDSWSRLGILQTYLRHDVNRAKDLAPRYLDARDASLRFCAALIVFRTGEKTRAREVLGEGLASQEVDDSFADAVEALLKDNSAGSRRQVARLFSNRHLQHERHGARAQIVRRCAQAGMKEPYQFYLPLLDVNRSELPVLDERGKESGASFFQPTVAEEYAREIVSAFAPDDPAVRGIAKKFPKAAAQIPYLKKWLRSHLGPRQDSTQQPDLRRSRSGTAP
jgi:hypothetical protein